MQLTQFSCRHFRCLPGLAFAPEPGINLLYGDNAQGKTSILEAILYCTTSRSHRTTTESDLRQQGEEGFRVALHAIAQGQPIQLEANWWHNQKRFKVNGIPQTRISDILGRIRVVFFAPEDVDLVKGSGSHRRRFLDMELAQLSPAYLLALQQYKKVLRQRNETVRDKRPDPILLDVFDEQLVQYGAILMAERRAFVTQLSAFAQNAYALVAGGELFSVHYLPSITPDQDFAETLKQNRERDIRRGQTLLGPHRDDLELTVDAKPARSFGSQGQQKTAALALKLAEVELIHHRYQEYPVLLLDEALAELDPHRARRLFDMLATQVQCLITTTERAPNPAMEEHPLTRFHVVRGHIEKT
ncbi:MAG: DNA replication/repair protein RecF [Candidatus Hydrogenedentes bacterium]|nr:DNA replication/repair protein RecF [Candidatus Hydrogenedentota bacterium]